MDRPAQRLVRQRDRLRLQVGVGGEAEEKLLVGQHVLEHRAVECRTLRRISQIVGTKSGEIEESLEPLRVGREKGNAEAANDRPNSGLMDCRSFEEWRILRFSFRKSLAVSICGLTGRLCAEWNPNAQDCAHR
jgi:hypothetical protein